MGEALACSFLTEHGLTVVARNQKVGRGEIDIVARDRSVPVVVEVRTLTGSSYPLDAIDDEKRHQVRRLASAIRVWRCDLVGIGLHDTHYIVHWDPNAAL